MKNSKLICVCGSMTFIDAMEDFAASLRLAGYKVVTPTRENYPDKLSKLSDFDAAEMKRRFVDEHLETIKRADLVLLANYSKNGTEGYIGASMLIEAAFAYSNGVPIAYVKPPGSQPCRLDVLALSQRVVGENIGAIGLAITQV